MSTTAGELAPRGAKSVADLAEQILSSRAGERIHYVEHNGVEMHLVDLHIATRIPYSTLTWRYRKGLRGADLIAPPDPKRTRKADRAVDRG